MPAETRQLQRRARRQPLPLLGNGWRHALKIASWRDCPERNRGVQSVIGGRLGLMMSCLTANPTSTPAKVDTSDRTTRLLRPTLAYPYA